MHRSISRTGRSSFAVFALLCLPPTSRGQDVPEVKGLSQATIDARKPMVLAAKAALDKHDAGGAERALLDALRFDPFALDLYELGLASSTLDADTRALLALRYAGAKADEKGAFAAPKPIVDAQPSLFAELQKLEVARAQAVSDVLGLGKKFGRGNKDVAGPIVARYLNELYLDLTRSAPASWKNAKPLFEDACSMRADAYVVFTNGLEKLMKDAYGNGKLEVAAMAARSLHGLAVQSALKDLKGPKAPDLSKKRQEAAEMLGRIRAMYAQANKPLSIEELDQMIEDDRIKFTLEHQTIANPGVSVTPNGLYRIETICGHGTLLGAAETVEYHHQRLVKWYGQDPFVGRPGTIRIVPEAVDLEVEGEPFWWAGGFQSGDTTVVRFNASNIAALGHGITHELTHRFDGALYGGLPSWLAEGRAVWTADSYGKITDEDFVPNKANFGTIEETMRRGYGGEEKLKKLLDGTIDDYRDNYVAGYALFVYLNSWEEPEGHKVFAPRLTNYLSTAGRSHKKPVDAFEDAFCDGKDGRPKDLKGFAQMFATFTSGFYWLANPRPTFLGRYNPNGLPGDDAKTIDDAPTWQFSRSRAEPWFGQEQAAEAGVLLAKNGMPTEAASALAFGMQVDEFHPERALMLADLLDKQRDPLAAFVLRAKAAFRDPDRYKAPTSPLLSAQLPKLKLFADQLRASADAIANTTPRAAAALRGDAARLLTYLGLDAKGESPPAFDQSKAPFCDIPHLIGRFSYVEDGLTDYEQYRVPNLWFTTDDGDLHVGREKPRDSTGTLDRNAGQHHAFARGQEWLTPGRTHLRGRIQFTTTFVNGAVIFGYTRRDRNLRFSFGAGDYMYSIGQKAEAEKMDSVNVSLTAIRDAEGGQEHPLPGTNVKFDSPRDSFEYEILIDGPLAVLFVDGKLIGSYSTVDAQPIEGYVGFAASMGAYRVTQATIELEHRIHDLCIDDPATRGLMLSNTGGITSRDILQRRVRGLPIPKEGAVVFWVPEPDPTTHEDGKIDPDVEAFQASTTARALSKVLWAFDFDPPLLVVVPRSFPEKSITQMKESFARDPVVRAPIFQHDKKEALISLDNHEVPQGLPMAIFVDSSGVARAMFPVYSFDVTVPPAEFLRCLKLQKARIMPPPDATSGDPAEPTPSSPKKKS